MELTGLQLIMMVLAAFRLTRLVVADTITEWIRRPFIHVWVEEQSDGEKVELWEPKGLIGEGITCYWCMGMWASLAIVLIEMLIPWGEYVVLILAIAGLQSILYGASERYL